MIIKIKVESSLTPLGNSVIMGELFAFLHTIIDKNISIMGLEIINEEGEERCGEDQR